MNFVFRSESTRFVLKNHLTATYPYIRAVNSSTGCTSIHHGFCKMLWYCSILFYIESVRSVVNQRNNNNIFTGLNVFFKALNFRVRQVSQRSFNSLTWLSRNYIEKTFLDKQAQCSGTCWQKNYRKLFWIISNSVQTITISCNSCEYICVLSSYRLVADRR